MRLITDKTQLNSEEEEVVVLKAVTLVYKMLQEEGLDHISSVALLGSIGLSTLGTHMMTMLALTKQGDVALANAALSDIANIKDAFDEVIALAEEGFREKARTH